MKTICSMLLAFVCLTQANVFAEEPKPAPAIPEAKKNVDDGKAVILDVREKEEFEKGHLKDARNVPLSELKNGNIPADLPKDKPIYTHCQKGARASEASAILNAKGYDTMPMKASYEEIQKGGFETAK